MLAHERKIKKSVVRESRITNQFDVLGGGSPGEHTIENQALALLTDDNEHFANLVGVGYRCATAALVFGSHRR
jgi:hypothetical protein